VPVGLSELTEAEQGLLSHLQNDYQLETDSLGGDPLLWRLKDSEVIRPLSATRNTVKALEERGLIAPAEGDDPIYGISSEYPESVLSSSQLNSLALSIFLSLNLGIRILPLDAALVDNLLQTLDSINLLGVVDLLRRARGNRQLLISTHDERFGRLLERKLRPINAKQRTRVFRLEGWAREGPSVYQYDAERDAPPLKIAI
jgi:hypothetical protein